MMMRILRMHDDDDDDDDVEDDVNDDNNDRTVGVL